MFHFLQKVSQFAIRFASISNDPPSTLSATFPFPNGNEERLNVGANEYVLPPWFDKEPFSALSEPFERKTVDSALPEVMESGEHFNDPYFHLSATFLFPNGNEERLNVGAEEYVLPPWFDKEPFNALSEPFERKSLDLISISHDPYFHLSAAFLFPNGNEERLNVGAKEYVLPPWLIRNRSVHYRSHSKGKVWILLGDSQTSHEWFDWNTAVVEELLAPMSIKRSF
ncbi:hypothetical protein CEXT_422691 [Caerostris extrusa]|uniref:Uncharacterized protein n=1 Tax=Caerostris extrusa TaxID=172846 RepID=A0AAV4Y0D0_CAEEX|nr:hypothetical protein CEXT_422691 [Caerostris extrusa]